MYVDFFGIHHVRFCVSLNSWSTGIFPFLLSFKMSQLMDVCFKNQELYFLHLTDVLCRSVLYSEYFDNIVHEDKILFTISIFNQFKQFFMVPNQLRQISENLFIK